MTMVFSPSSTKTWLQCPLKWHLHREGWSPCMLGKPALARILGQSVARGLEAHYTARQTGLNSPVPPAEEARKVYQDTLAKMLENGHVIYDGELDTAGLMPNIAAQCVQRVMASDPIPLTWEILQVETPLGERYGNARPDLVVRTESGQVAIIDWKVKRTLDPRYQDRTLQEFREAGQFSHYRWAYGEILGGPVTLSYTHLIVCEPRFRQILDPCQADPEIDQMWLAGRRRVWAQMEKEVMGEADPWIAEDHWDKYGRCEYWKACFECKLDEKLMGADYVQEKRKERVR